MIESQTDIATQIGKDLAKYDWFIAIGVNSSNEIILYVNDINKAKEKVIPVYSEVIIRLANQPKI